MKTLVLLGALVAGAAAPVAAQNPPAAPTLTVETSAATVLTPAFVRSCVYIGSGHFEAQKADDAALGTFRYEGYHRLKGADALRVRGLIVPTVAQTALGREAIVFARFDGASKRGVVAATLPLTPQNSARVDALIAAQPMLQFSVQPSKARYAFGEPMTVKWAIKNISGAPLSIYTGEEATNLSLEYGGSSRSSSDVQARKRALTTRLQNGETWQYERTFEGDFPVGSIGISWYYDGGEALKGRGALPDDLYLDWQRGESQTQVVPVTAKATWKTRRKNVKNLFTPAQLDVEIALARRMRYDDFAKGPGYEQVAAIVDDGQKINFLGSPEMDKINDRIRALPREAVPTLFQLFHWRGIDSPPVSALEVLADSGDLDAFVQLAQVAYGRNDGDARVAAIRLMAKLDFERAKPHIEAFFKQPFAPHDWSLEAPRLGAALVLAGRGEKRAVPIFFSAPYERSLIFLRNREVREALRLATGLDFPTVEQWRGWWEREGSKQEWKS